MQNVFCVLYNVKNIFIYADEKSAINYVNAVKNTSIECNITCSLDVSKCTNHTHLILCGGGDVDPAFYGMQRHSCNNVNLLRDLAEFYLINHFYKKNLPILGICRGMQILNVAFGGNLTQIITDKNLHYKNICDTLHPIECNGGFMKLIYGEQLMTNSAHRQAVNFLGKNLVSCCYSDDILCEAFEHKYSNILGVQFHPERMGALGLYIYDYFLNLN